MALSAIGRKALLPHGAGRKIARRLGIEESRVSIVLGGQNIPRSEEGWKSYRKVQRAIARALNLSIDEAFSEIERGEDVPAEQMSA